MYNHLVSAIEVTLLRAREHNFCQRTLPVWMAELAKMEENMFNFNINGLFEDGVALADIALQAFQIFCKLEGRKVANAQRQINGHSLAYNEESFLELEEELGNLRKQLPH